MTHDFTLSGLKQYRILCYNTKKYVCKTTSQRTHQVIVVLSVRNWIFSKTKTSATGTRTGNFLFREVSSLTKKAAKSMIPHGFAAWLDGEIDGYSIMVRFSRSIFFFFNSKDECTYLFSVIFTLECPKISLRRLILNPSSTHLVAKVCLSAW